MYKKYLMPKTWFDQKSCDTRGIGAGYNIIYMDSFYLVGEGRGLVGTDRSYCSGYSCLARYGENC